MRPSRFIVYIYDLLHYLFLKKASGMVMTLLCLVLPIFLLKTVFCICIQGSLIRPLHITVHIYALFSNKIECSLSVESLGKRCSSFVLIAKKNFKYLYNTQINFFLFQMKSVDTIQSTKTCSNHL